MPLNFPIQYPAELPLTQKLDEIKQALQNHQVIIVGGETGSGKTTQLPKICLEIGRGQKGMIAHTQPRRLAARSVSQRIAEELHVELGREVGYQVRFSDICSAETQVKLMTDGILLAEIQQDVRLGRYDTIIIDEAHERSLNIDFLLGYIKNLLPRRPDLKLIITSATIDLEKFSAHFGGAPIIEVSGRTFPIELVYRPVAEEEENALADNIIDAVRELFVLEKKHAHKRGDILVFLSGEREILEVAQALRKADFRNTEILPLYARLSNREQNRVFQSHVGRRIVLATNVAETSITVPGITCVIDPGMARLSRYSVRSKVQRLPIEAISQASANQRAGRCGRVAPGICIRLYSEEDYLSRPAFTDTEITRTNLASVILQMHALGLGDIEAFPFLDKPESKAIGDGIKVLQEIGAITAAGELDKAGRLMAKLPVDPRFARILLEASGLHCLREILIIVSAMSIPDPRERPLDRQQAADEKHRIFEHPQSDFLSYIKLWQAFEETRQASTQGQLRKYCQRHFLSYLRMREWREIHRQLHLQCRELGLTENKHPANEDAIHQALLSGLISHVARHHDEGEYLGTRNRKLRIFPGSSLFRSKPAWILSAELVETSRLYARTNARIKPEWIEKAAAALLTHDYLEPHWEKKRGEVMAYEKVSLYGLTIIEKRKVSFSRVDPATSRELFIRRALVEMDIHTQARFFRHNQALIEKLNKLEDKTRRRDILVDDETLYAFYDALIPAEVCNTASLESWYRKLDKEHAQRLVLTEAKLVRSDSGEIELSAFPDRLSLPTMALKLDYQFAPGMADDGVSVDVPVSALKQLTEDDLDWLVPGMLREKCIALVKALPKHVRKIFVPVPDVVERLMADLNNRQDGTLKELLARGLTKIAGMRIDPGLWNNYSLDQHLKMNIRVIDEHGKLLGAGRDLSALQKTFAGKIQQQLRHASASTIERSGIRQWDLGELPEVYEIRHHDVILKTYPALLDEDDSVALTLCDNAGLAGQESLWGIVRLLILGSSDKVKYLKKMLLKDGRLNILLSEFGDREHITDQLIRAAFRHAFLHNRKLPRIRAEFDEIYEQGRSELIPRAERLQQELLKIMQHYHQISSRLQDFHADDSGYLLQDVTAQLAELLHADFITDTEPEQYFELSRYLQAIMERLDKFPRQKDRDRQCGEVLQKFFSRYQNEYERLVQQNRVSPELDRFKWMIEEYRVSLFAQQLGTREAVSEKRLDKFWREEVLSRL